LSGAEQVKFLNEIVPATIKEELTKRNRGTESWTSSKNILNKSPVKKFGELGDEIMALAISPDGKTVYVSNGSNLSARDSTTGKILFIFEQSKGYHIKKIKISADGRFLYTDTDDGLVTIWDLEKKEFVKAPIHGISAITAIATSRDGAFLYSGSSDGKLRFSDLRKKKWIGTFLNHLRDLFRAHRIGTNNSGEIIGLAVSPNNNTLYSLLSYGTLEFVDLKSKRLAHSLDLHAQLTGFTTTLALSPDGKIAYIGTKKGYIFKVNTKTRQLVGSVKRHQGEVTALTFSPDRNILYSASTDHQIGIWNLKTGESVQIPSGYQKKYGNIESLVVTPDGKRLFILFNSKETFVLDLERAHPHWIVQEESR
jgi:WD40 repeat protein